MAKNIRVVCAVIVVLNLMLAQVAAADLATDTPCLYPSPNERFGITTASESLNGWDVRLLHAGAWHNWATNWRRSNDQGLRYYPTIQVSETGFEPERQDLERLIPLHPGATWLIGSEVDTVWMGNVLPETYARLYHDLYTFIKARDPSAKIAISGFATVSPLRLAWLDRAWEAYRAMYGAPMPVDVWNIHTYVVNEMVHEWGPQIPPGIANAVGYTPDHWQRLPVPGASGGSVHANNRPGARAYFAVHGDPITLFLHTGPDAGVADIYIDNRQPAVEHIDLYAPLPGVVSRTYTDLPRGDYRLGDWHHVRVQVGWFPNPRSQGSWVRVDAAAAPSTAQLPTGRLEDDYPLRARILTSTDSYLDVNQVHEMLRLFRRWMVEHGQRDKPLINSEFGVLLGERQGVTYPQVRDFMLGTFDLFMHQAIDPELGYPADGNRLLQEWFWFTLAGDYFNGARVYTGLFDPETRRLLPLGGDFANLVRPLARLYADLAVTHAQWSASWPLFAGQPARFAVQAAVANLGPQSVGPFQVTLSNGTQTIKTWAVPGLTGREGERNTLVLQHAWQSRMPGTRTFTLTLDSANQVDEPCDPNNEITYTAVGPSHVDLAMEGVKVTVHRRLAANGTAASDVLVDLGIRNLGSVGTQAGAIPVSLWRIGAPQAPQLLDQQSLSPEAAADPRVRLKWADAPVGDHELSLQIGPLPDDADVTNNQITLHVHVHANTLYLPLMGRD